MPQTTEPLREELIPALSAFLRKGFCEPGRYCDFTDPEVLRWKFFEPRGHWKIPRSLIVADAEKILAHVGVCPTEFTAPGQSFSSVPTVHITDWLNGVPGGSVGGLSFGALLMLRSFDFAPVQYAFGSTPVATRVLIRGGFSEMFQVPLFHRVLARTNREVWRTLHGNHRSARGAALLAVDLLQSFRHRATPRSIQATRVSQFSGEAESVLKQCQYSVIITGRSDDLLNYYLRFPKNSISGWILKKADRVIGFGLLALIQKPGLRQGRIVDCFLNTNDCGDWKDSIAALSAELRRMKPDLISCYASTPWLREGLVQNGYFRRGKIAFLLRDSKKLIPRSHPFHLTHLEADLSYL